VLNKQTTEIVM